MIMHAPYTRYDMRSCIRVGKRIAAGGGWWVVCEPAIRYARASRFGLVESHAQTAPALLAHRGWREPSWVPRRRFRYVPNIQRTRVAAARRSAYSSSLSLGG